METNLEPRLEVTRELVFREATSVLQDGKKPKLSDIAYRFKKPTSAGLRVYFNEWKEANADKLKNHSEMELMLLAKLEQKNAIIDELEDTANRLKIDLTLLEQKHNNVLANQQSRTSEQHDHELRHKDEQIKRLKETLEQYKLVDCEDYNGVATTVVNLQIELQQAKNDLKASELNYEAIIEQYKQELLAAKVDSVDTVVRTINESEMFGIVEDQYNYYWFFGQIESKKRFGSYQEALVDYITWSLEILEEYHDKIVLNHQANNPGTIEY